MRTLYKALLLSAAVVLGLIPLAPVRAAAGPPAVGARSGILVDAETGEILWSRDAQIELAPASLTKIVTALAVLEDADLEARAPITPEARRAEGTRTYAEEGWTFTIQEHLSGLLLQSGNDSAVALAQALSPDGEVGGFVARMNSLAEELGATKTHLVNPHGLDAPGHVSTARDLALISIAALRDPLIAEMAATKTHNIPWGDGSTHTFINQNRLLWRYPGAVGIKTGYTDQAGRTLAAVVTRDGTTLVTILLDSPRPTDEAIAIYDWAFGSLPALRAQPVGTLPLEGLEPAAGPVSGLEIVEVASEAPRTPPSPASFLGPLAALAGALAVYRTIRGRDLDGGTPPMRSPAIGDGVGLAAEPGASAVSTGRALELQPHRAHRAHRGPSPR